MHTVFISMDKSGKLVHGPGLKGAERWASSEFERALTAQQKLPRASSSLPFLSHLICIFNSYLFGWIGKTLIWAYITSAQQLSSRILLPERRNLHCCTAQEERERERWGRCRRGRGRGRRRGGRTSARRTSTTSSRSPPRTPSPAVPSPPSPASPSSSSTRPQVSQRALYSLSLFVLVLSMFLCCVCVCFPVILFFCTPPMLCRRCFVGCLTPSGVV